MKLTLFFIPKYPAVDHAIDFDENVEPFVFEDHIGAVVPVVGDICWVTSPAPALERVAARIVERGMTFDSRGIGVTLRWEFLS
jgi:hypothetical protein